MRTKAESLAHIERHAPVWYSKRGFLLRKVSAKSLDRLAVKCVMVEKLFTRTERDDT